VRASPTASPTLGWDHWLAADPDADRSVRRVVVDLSRTTSTKSVMADPISPMLNARWSIAVAMRVSPVSCAGLSTFIAGCCGCIVCQTTSPPYAEFTHIHTHTTVITVRVSRRRREMYCGHARLCVCLSAAACLHYCTDPDVTSGSGSGCPLVVHCRADLQSVHGLRCYGNIKRTRHVSEYMLVLARCLVFPGESLVVR